MKTGETYRNRILDDVLERKLDGAGAVLVEGPKWCGKTTTCEQHAKSILYLADPVRRERYLAQAAVDVTELLKGEIINFLYRAVFTLATCVSLLTNPNN